MNAYGVINQGKGITQKEMDAVADHYWKKTCDYIETRFFESTQIEDKYNEKFNKQFNDVSNDEADNYSEEDQQI